MVNAEMGQMGHEQTTLPVFHIARLRFDSDGKGITSLVGVAGCPNRCKYCINASWLKKTPRNVTPQELYDLLKVDDLYFRTTGGGVTFGGGEPLLWPRGIEEFARIVDGKWKINVETSLNVPWENVEPVIPYADAFFIDIKDMCETIYDAYTGNSGFQMRTNLARLMQIKPQCVFVRVPRIPEYNTDEDISRSKSALLRMGIENIEFFTYRKCEAHWD